MRWWRAVWPLVLLVAGCATYASRMAPAIKALRQGEAGRAVEHVDRNPDPGSVLWQLERGLLLRAAGRFRESNEALAAAARRDDELYTRSISNESAALAISDAVRPYRSADHERPFVHVYSALNYLDLGDREGALVEARALTELLQAHIAPGDESGADDWGFGRLLAGLVLESGGEWNDAWIAYRAARAAYGARDAGPSPQLRDLLDEAVRRTAVRAGLESGEIEPESARIVVVVEEGLVTPMEDFHLRVPILKEEESWGEDQLGPWSEIVSRRACDLRRHRVHHRRQEVAYFLDVAVPVYPERPAPPPGPSMVWVMGRAPAAAVFVENVEELARENLERSYPVIAARAAARALIKALASRAVSRRSGEVPGKLANLLGVATERADTRSWSTLPGWIGLAVIEVPPGPAVVQVESMVYGRSAEMSVTAPESGWAFLDCRLLP